MLISSLEILTEVSHFNVSQRGVHNFGVNEKTLSVTKKIVLRCSPLSCLRLYRFSIKRKNQRLFLVKSFALLIYFCREDLEIFWCMEMLLCFSSKSLKDKSCGSWQASLKALWWIPLLLLSKFLLWNIHINGKYENWEAMNDFTKDFALLGSCL